MDRMDKTDNRSYSYLFPLPFLPFLFPFPFFLFSFSLFPFFFHLPFSFFSLSLWNTVALSVTKIGSNCFCFWVVGAAHGLFSTLTSVDVLIQNGVIAALAARCEHCDLFVWVGEWVFFSFSVFLSSFFHSFSLSFS